MTFYNPISTTLDSTPVLAYPCKGVEAFFDRAEKGTIEKYLAEFYSENSLQNKGEYNIVILWTEGKDVMVDRWIFDKIESWGSGPLAYVKVFRNGEIDEGSGVSAGDGLVLLGIEEQHRWKSESLKEYLEGERPELPERIWANEDFYL